MIKIFSHFTNNGKVKDYVYKRMKKKILELVVCVVQEIIFIGIGRARTLKLELVKTKYGGKTVQIVDPFQADREKFDEAFLGKIDEAFFCLKDSEVNSPGINLAAGHDHKAPCILSLWEGWRIPSSKATSIVVRSLETSIEVANFLRRHVCDGLHFPRGLFD